MKPTFFIKRKGAQDERSIAFDKVLSPKILGDICFRLTNQMEYEIKWIEDRNIGRLIVFDTTDIIHFITLSPYERVVSRNSYFRSVPTAFGIYLQEQSKIEKRCDFSFYFLPCSGNNRTDYMKFMFEILSTIGIGFINREYGLQQYIPSPITSVKELIQKRNINSGANSGNQPTYLTEEGKFYHIYGKTFGANEKETALICMAICKVADKPVRLFQIVDNESNRITENDAIAIEIFSQSSHTNHIDILDDSYEFEEIENEVVLSQPAPQENLRHPRFIYNLLEKTHGIKKCTLCQCNIESLVQGAHIYPVKNIKQLQGVSYEQKLALATDKDNSLWLCENHHKLFDCGQIHFVNDEIVFSNSLNETEKAYLNEITTLRHIEKELYTHGMRRFLQMRDEVYNAMY